MQSASLRVITEKRDYFHKCKEAVRYEKDLGVIVDDELKFHQQTATKKNLIASIIAIGLASGGNRACFRGNRACFRGNRACFRGNRACFRGNRACFRG